MAISNSREAVPMLSGRRLSIATGPADIIKGVDCHLRYDVRHWPNPHGDPTMSKISGAHPMVQEWLIQKPKIAREILDMVEEVRELFVSQAQTWASVGLYCKGGRHRSLMAAWTMSQVLSWSDVRSTIWRLQWEPDVLAEPPAAELMARVHAEIMPGSFAMPAMTEAEHAALTQIMATATWLQQTGVNK